MRNKDTFVIDTRSGTRLGPYSPKDASVLAVQLNDFVRRNAGIVYNPFKVDRSA